nr:molybdopterin molybdotransferase MoeA [Streptomyces caatingaensis]
MGLDAPALADERPDRSGGTPADVAADAAPARGEAAGDLRAAAFPSEGAGRERPGADGGPGARARGGVSDDGCTAASPGARRERPAPSGAPERGGAPDGGRAAASGAADDGRADTAAHGERADHAAAPGPPTQERSRAGGRGGGHRAPTPWPTAGRIAAGAAEALPAEEVPLGEALGRTLAGGLDALTDLPPFDTAAMDGWAVAGPGPWRLPGEPADEGIVAGRTGAEPLRDGCAVPIATGARVPPGATAVLRREHGRTTAQGELYATRRAGQGQDIRPRAQECRGGDGLLPAGSPVTPAVLGLAAAAGYDVLSVTARPRVAVLVLGDELVHEGLPHDGRIRDALGPMLGPWLRALGAEVTAEHRLGDDAEALYEALAGADADLVITTGSTASGPRDHLHPALRRLGAELLVDGVAVRPGHPMLLARLAEDRHLVGLPGNPLAAVAGLLTLAEPLLRTLSGRPAPSLRRAVLGGPVPSHPSDTRLVPVVLRGGDGARPLRFHGPAMLRGLAAADAMAVIPPGGSTSRGRVALLDLPWQ